MPSKHRYLRPKLLSLFCGAGGLDLGFEKQGFEVSLAFDLRSESIESYNYNRPYKSGHVHDIRRLDLETLDKLHGAVFKPIGLIGGPPCQGFSISNVHKSESDPRNNLGLHFARILRDLNERSPIHFFVFENVKGLLDKKHATTYLTIENAFKDCGFKIKTSILNASNYGTPQSRERLLIVGLNSEIYSSEEFAFPKPSVSYSKSPITVRKTIGNLPKPIYYSDYRISSTKPAHPNHWCMTPKSPKFKIPGALQEGQSFGRSFRTLFWDKPSPTVAYGNREVHVHPSGTRRLSVYEAMLLQGFPKKYVLLGNLSQQITQISEAVPPPLSRAIAKTISETLSI